MQCSFEDRNITHANFPIEPNCIHLVSHHAHSYNAAAALLEHKGRGGGVRGLPDVNVEGTEDATVTGAPLQLVNDAFHIFHVSHDHCWHALSDEPDDELVQTGLHQLQNNTGQLICERYYCCLCADDAVVFIELNSMHLFHWCT